MLCMSVNNTRFNYLEMQKSDSVNIVNTKEVSVV